MKSIIFTVYLFEQLLDLLSKLCFGARVLLERFDEYFGDKPEE